MATDDNTQDSKSTQEFAPDPPSGAESADSSESITGLDGIMDVPVTISLEVGNSIISIKDLLQLNQGSVIELDRNAGDPLDIKINGRLLAHGEVVVINNKFGVRLTSVVSLSDRIKRFDR